MGLQQQNKMNVGYLLVSLASLTTAIRVDWNTNQGPIVPPIPTVQPVPQPPFRSPAPVWEDQSNDIPNPNPYQYVLPPPSRPKYPDNNYLTAPLYPNRQTAYQVVPIPATAINSLYYNYKNNIVPSLGIQYIPNIGNRYTYVIPSSGTATASTTTTTTTSASKSGNYIKPDKLNGKYNPKLKKYKAYEKFSNNNKRNSYYYNSAFQQQQLPYMKSPQPFRAIVNPSSTSIPAAQAAPASTKLYSIVKQTLGNNSNANNSNFKNNNNKKYNHNNPNTIVNLSKKS